MSSSPSPPFPPAPPAPSTVGDRHRQPPRLRRHAHHRPRHLGPAPRPRRGRAGAAPGGRPRRRLHRHGRLLRPRGERGAHRRGAGALPRAASSSPPRAGWSAPGPRQLATPTAGPSTCARRCEGSLARLGVEQVTLYQFHRPDPGGARSRTRWASWCALRDEGKIAHIGLSNVTVDELARAQALTPDRVGPEPLQPDRPRLRATWSRRPSATASRSSPGRRSAGTSPARATALAAVAARHGVSPVQVALAWQLARSPQMLPIPGHLVGRPPRGERGRRRRSSSTPTTSPRWRLTRRVPHPWG